MTVLTAMRLGINGLVLHALLPRIALIATNTRFRMFPDSSASKGAKGGETLVRQKLSPVAVQQMMREIHVF